VSLGHTFLAQPLIEKQRRREEQRGNLAKHPPDSTNQLCGVSATG